MMMMIMTEKGDVDSDYPAIQDKAESKLQRQITLEYATCDFCAKEEQNI